MRTRVNFMDELERRLKQDAADIPADVSAELAMRIDASLRAAERIKPRAGAGRRGFSIWWMSSLTGVAGALLVIAVLNRNDTSARNDTAAVDAPAAPIASAVPDYRSRTQSEFPLRAETAVLTEPLEEELEKLRSDLETARDKLEEDFRRSF